MQESAAKKILDFGHELILTDLNRDCVCAKLSQRLMRWIGLSRTKSIFAECGPPHWRNRASRSGIGEMPSCSIWIQ